MKKKNMFILYVLLFLLVLASQAALITYFRDIDVSIKKYLILTTYMAFAVSSIVFYYIAKKTK